MTRLFCFGLGYSARVLALRLQSRGFSIAGTTRSLERKAALEASGFEMHLFDRDRPLDPEALFGTTHFLHSIIPDETGDPVFDQHAQDLKRLDTLSWMGWLGTTAVYGDRGGAWVDEDAVCAPIQPRARRRLKAENAWLSSGLPVHIFRLAGIYGPGRNPLVDILAGRGRRIIKPGQVFSRIHVEDIATVLEASIDRPNPGTIYNVCDDEPAPPQDVVSFAAELLGALPPPALDYETADLSAMARSFYADNRRVSNRRIKDELGVALAFPTYREGLTNCLETIPEHSRS